MSVFVLSEVVMGLITRGYECGLDLHPSPTPLSPAYVYGTARVRLASPVHCCELLTHLLNDIRSLWAINVNDRNTDF